MPSQKKSNNSLANRYKKQNGLHHARNKRYLKVYWPYLPLLMFIGVGIAASLFIVVTRSTSAAKSPSMSDASLLSQTNQAREVDNGQPLLESTSLDQAAQQKANSMVQQNYWSHISPSGQTPWQLILASGYKFQQAGENLAYGFSSSKAVMSAWLNSPDHRANVLSTNYDDVGFGIARSNNFQGQGPQTVIVAMYASPSGEALSTNTHGSTSNSAYTNLSVVQPNQQTVARVDTLTSNYPLLAVFITGLVGGAVACFLIIRHAVKIKRWLVKGEAVVIEHPLIDLALVIVVIACALLNQTTGFIR